MIAEYMEYRNVRLYQQKRKVETEQPTEFE